VDLDAAAGLPDGVVIAVHAPHKLKGTTRTTITAAVSNRAATRKGATLGPPAWCQTTTTPRWSPHH
jgi:uncharacterized membrane protein